MEQGKDGAGERMEQGKGWSRGAVILSSNL